ncbi:MAG TPA: malate synthase G [Xanthomonadales bacterium]|nr:malate synthase G [Xanthomonadales bacterium]
MTDYQSRAGLSVDPVLAEFVENELLPDLDFEAERFWSGLAAIVGAMTGRNRDLLERREQIQGRIDDFHRASPGVPDPAVYRDFLEHIGYLHPQGDAFSISTKNVDPEIATVAGPQLVVPVSNARFALNAANARWGSLYDALYGTDVISEEKGLEKGTSYNPARGKAVIEYAAKFLDVAIPLQEGNHADVREYRLREDGGKARLEISLADGRITNLVQPELWLGYSGSPPAWSLLFQNNGLHIEILIDPAHPVGRETRDGVADVILEAAVTTIQDCEDSVAAVDAEDKAGVYRNWLGLMRGSLEAEFVKGGKTVVRRLSEDRSYTTPQGTALKIPGRSVMLVRNVGHLMTNPAVLDSEGNEVFEGILDAVITATCALYDLRSPGTIRNSRTGSIYIVKPKMHGPDEAAYTNDLFTMVEDMLDIPRNTMKVGVMDEERRTTVNLAECIRAVAERLVFINTGFLDRTGDEIHTSMLAGPVLPKEAIKTQPWILAYEDWNVDVGIRCGLRGKAQIGKGMWPKPDEMRAMVESKRAHLEQGASCAWVPSPTAATLHAMHYHEVSVTDRQEVLAKRKIASLDDILTPPLGDSGELASEQIQAELDNNAQGILGYVVRWIDQGVGCSKVPDIHDVGLMEDRATLRISSQHIANWLLHEVCDEKQVRETLERMAEIVDRQNQDDPAYTPMAPGFDNSIAFQAACDLVFKGVEQPSGYTEPLLHSRRLQLKASRN